MSANATSTFTFLLFEHCANVYTVFNGIKTILLLPLSIFILYLGFKKWRQQHSLKTASHSDLFTYHLASMELIWVFGWFCMELNRYFNVAALRLVGRCLPVTVYYGEILFNVLTCVERYLAVVHPLIYMGLKNTPWVRIRNIIIGCVWVLCSVLMSIHVFFTDYKAIELFCLLAVSIIVTCYCSISIFCVFIRPGPGGGARQKERVDQSKQRAFHTIAAISSALLLWFVGMLVAVAIKGSYLLNNDVSCLVGVALAFLNLPSYLVSPLLYLHRAGKLTFTCCCRE